jgi:hypothetical protein
MNNRNYPTVWLPRLSKGYDHDPSLALESTRLFEHLLPVAGDLPPGYSLNSFIIHGTGFDSGTWCNQLSCCRWVVACVFDE